MKSLQVCVKQDVLEMSDCDNIASRLDNAMRKLDDLTKQRDADRTLFSKMKGETPVDIPEVIDLGTNQVELPKTEIPVTEVDKSTSKVSEAANNMTEKAAKYTEAEKTGNKAKIDVAKAEYDSAKANYYAAVDDKKIVVSDIVDSIQTKDDLLTSLEGLSVKERKELIDTTLADSKSFQTYIESASREEAQDLASVIGSKTTDANYADKIMESHYYGFSKNIKNDTSTMSKLSNADKDLVNRASTRQAQATEFSKLDRIESSIDTYKGVADSSDIGKIKLNSIIESGSPTRSQELRDLLTDKNVKEYIRDPVSADEIFNKVYDINPEIAVQYQKAAQDVIISDIKKSSSYAKLSKDNQKFIDGLYTHKTYTSEDIVRLGEIQDALGRTAFNNLIHGTSIGITGFARELLTSPVSTTWKYSKRPLAAYAAVNMAMFVYFAAEEGVQSLIQMTGYSTPLDQYMKYMEEQGIPALENMGTLLGPFDWFLENVPFGKVLFPSAQGFKWYNEEVVPGLMKDKLAKGINGGLWIADTSGCTFGVGCFGHIRPEAERPAYWAAHPETIGFLDGDLVRRIYDMQADGSIGPNNLIAKGLGITDSTLATQVGMGHMIAAGNMGAKETLTKEFSNAYDMLVKGGAKSELAQQAYSTALAGTVKVDSATTPGAIDSTKLTLDQRAALSVAPTKADALLKYATYGGTQPQDSIAWRSIFVNADGALDIAKLKATYPDITSAEIQSLFPDEAINKAIKADLASVSSDPVALASKLAKYKLDGIINDNARIEQYLPADAAAAFTARQNNPVNFKITASGDTISWIDDTGYPHTENIIKAGKVLNPTTGQYDINQKKQDSGGAEYTLDTGKYATWLSSGGKDTATFLADSSNWTCTYNCSKASTTKKTSSSGGSSYSKGSSSYTKTAAETGLFVDAGGLQADITIAGAVVGKTDVKIPMAAGTYDIVFSKTGYKSRTMAGVVIYTSGYRNLTLTLYKDTSSGSTTTGDTTTTTPASSSDHDVCAMLRDIGGVNALTADHVLWIFYLYKGWDDLALALYEELDPQPSVVPNTVYKDDFNFLYGQLTGDTTTGVTIAKICPIGG
jgi:hypothetical protein